MHLFFIVQTDKAFTALAELLSYDKSREKYLKMVKKDKDFDNLKGEILYRDLFNMKTYQDVP